MNGNVTIVVTFVIVTKFSAVTKKDWPKILILLLLNILMMIVILFRTLLLNSKKLQHKNSIKVKMVTIFQGYRVICDI